MLTFPNFDDHPDYLQAQSKPWCDQLAAQTGKYAFPWRTVPDGEQAEERLSRLLRERLHGHVLDVGCGHGEYTVQWADRCEELVGYDMTEGFVATARRDYCRPNMRYVVGNTHDQGGLPFPDGYFDVAYTKKGPSSWYAEGRRVVRPGGEIILLHPGDGDGEGGELGLAFPGLFGGPAPGTPILDRIRARLAASGLEVTAFERLCESGWLPSAEDVLAVRGFGQSEAFKRHVRGTCFAEIERRFEACREPEGLRTTGFYYLIMARVPE